MNSLDLDTLLRVAEAIEFDEHAVRQLTDDPGVADRLHELLAVRSAVAAENAPSPGFVETTLARMAVVEAGRGPAADSPRARPPRSRWLKRVVGASLTGVLAALATFFGLLVTRAGASGDPVSIITIAVAAGAIVGLQSSGGRPRRPLRSP